MKIEYLPFLLVFLLVPSCLLQSRNVIKTKPLLGKKGEPIQEFFLENGMKILLQEDHTLPIVSIHILYRVGSANEPSGKQGIAHMFEHMMFKGSKNYKPEEHARLIQEAGGNVNAFTTEDYTGYYETLPKEGLELALKLEAERMHLLDLSEKTVNSEREVVKEEKRIRIDNQPIARLFEKFREVSFRGHPYSWTPAGDIAALDTVTPQDCIDFYKKFYSPDNSVLIVTGDTTPETLLPIVSSLFGSIRRSEGGMEEVPEVPEIKGERREVLEAEVQLPATIGGFSIPPARHEDIPVLEVISKILSDGESSRLHRKLVREEQIAVVAGASLASMKKGGSFIFFALYFPKFSHTLIEEKLLEEFEKFKKDGPSPKELLKAKNLLQSQFIMQLSTLEGRGFLIGFFEMMLGDYREFLRIEERYKSITLDDCIRVSNRYFTRDNLTLMSLKPKTSGKEKEGGER